MPPTIIKATDHSIPYLSTCWLKNQYLIWGPKPGSLSGKQGDLTGMQHSNTACHLYWYKFYSHSWYSNSTVDGSIVNRKWIICHSAKQVYVWPKQLNIWNQWDAYIAKNIPQICVKKSHGICYLHFRKPDDFTNYDVWVENIKTSKIITG